MKLLLAFLVLGVGLAAAGCPVDQFCPLADCFTRVPSDCEACLKNTNTGGKTGSTSHEACVANPGFYYNANDGITACPTGSTSADGSKAVDDCVAEAGYTGSGTKVTKCEANTYKAGPPQAPPSAEACTACPINSNTAEQ
jgi:hypothetical protein